VIGAYWQPRCFVLAPRDGRRGRGIESDTTRRAEAIGRNIVPSRGTHHPLTSSWVNGIAELPQTASLCRNRAIDVGVAGSATRMADPETFPEARIRSIQTGLCEWFRTHRRMLPWRGDAPPFTGSGARASVQKRREEAKGKAQTTLTAFLAKPVRSSSPVQEAGKPMAAPLPPSAYGTWVSEIMLQQTRVEAVIPFFLRWMDTFPTVDALAASTEEDVLAAWAGLGYYRRAKFLHKGAQYVVSELKGKIPSTVEELLKIPGVGEYTAGAIASIAFGARAPLVDGNVIRVFSRLSGSTEPASDSKLRKECWKLASALVPEGNPGEFNQAVMELGATICTPTDPDCGHCPLRATCSARALEDAGVTVIGPDIEDLSVSLPSWVSTKAVTSDGLGVGTRLRVTHFPGKAIKAESRSEIVPVTVLFLLSDEPRVLIQRRPSTGLLAGQWDWPQAITETPRGRQPKRPRDASEISLEEALAVCPPLPLTDESAVAWSCQEYTYVFSGAKQQVRVSGVVARRVEPLPVLDSDSCRWVTLDELAGVGLSSFACKVFATSLERPLTAARSGSMECSLLPELGHRLLDPTAREIARDLLSRAKLLSQATKQGWWPK
jgi:A/G-specific adenine glycosylase